MKELRDQIKEGESDILEFKESFTREVAITAGAFANTKGGTILIGVSDRGEAKGTQISDETLKDWANQISQATEPRVIPEIEVVEADGKKVVVIGIKEFPIKPVAVRGRCYRRVGNSNRVLQPPEIAQMHIDSTGTSWDRLPARDASLDDIDLENVRMYIKRANESGRRKIGDKEDPYQVLEKLKLMKDGHPCWGAILLFSKDPQGFLSQAVVHSGRFKEEIVVIDDRMIDGPITEQIDEAMDFVKKNITVEFVMTGKPRRDQVWEYPLEAVREAIINAVCHRDYTIPSNVEVRIYDDRLEVWSPGRLPSGIALEDLFKPHSSHLRNKGIGGVFYDMELIEQWGGGIDKMLRFCGDTGLPEPEFKEDQGFRVIFRKDIHTEENLRTQGLNERQIKIVLYAKEKKQIRISTVKTLIPEVSEKTLYRDLQDLVEKGILKEVGEKKGRFYVFR